MYLVGEPMRAHVARQRDNMVLLGSTTENKRYTSLLARITVYALRASLTTINHRSPLVL